MKTIVEEIESKIPGFKYRDKYYPNDINRCNICPYYKNYICTLTEEPAGSMDSYCAISNKSL